MIVQKFSLRSFGEYLGQVFKRNHLQFQEGGLNGSVRGLEGLPGSLLGDRPAQIPAAIRVCVTESYLHLWTFKGACQPRLLHYSKLSPGQIQRLRAAFETSPQATQALMERLGSLDFDPLLQKLWTCHGHQKDGWSRSRLYKAVQSYACFLLDAALCPGVPLPATSGDMDEVWHCHILQTQKYTDDCDTLLGYYLHHEPLPEPVQVFGACNDGIRRDRPLATADAIKCHVGVQGDRPSVADGIRSCNIGISHPSVIAGTGACRTSSSVPKLASAQAA